MVWGVTRHSLTCDHIQTVQCEHCGGIQAMRRDDRIAELKSGGRNVSAGLPVAHTVTAAELSTGKSGTVASR
jgi:hypothetical protein